MTFPSLESAYMLSPGSIEFHRKIVNCFEAYVEETDFQDVWKVFINRDWSLKEKYGYGGTRLFPYGAFHPTKVLDKCLNGYSRGRIGESRIHLFRPDYIYRYSADGEMVSIDCKIKRKVGWEAPQITTLPIKTESPHTHLMLTFLSRNVNKEPLQLRYIAWEDTHGEANYCYIVEGGIFDGQYKLHQCTTEIQQLINNQLVCDRYEYRIIPNREGTERLFRNTFITK